MILPLNVSEVLNYPSLLEVLGLLNKPWSLQCFAAGQKMSSRTVVAVHWGGLKFIGSTGISVRQGLRAPIKKAAKTDEVIHLIYVIKAKLICLGNNGAMRGPALFCMVNTPPLQKWMGCGCTSEGMLSLDKLLMFFFYISLCFLDS